MSWIESIGIGLLISIGIIVTILIMTFIMGLPDSLTWYKQLRNELLRDKSK